MKILNILVRRYLALEDMDAAVTFYESLVGQRARLRFDYPERQLKLAQVASILLIAGTPESLEPFTDTHMTFLVDDLGAYEQHLPDLGVEIIRAPQDVPTGRNMLVRHPDGSVVEYVEHRVKNPADRLPG